MMEKTPVSVSMGRSRGEITWMPEKARGCSGEGFLDWGSGEWLVASGEWGPRSSVDGEERFLASLEMTVFLSCRRRPESWRLLVNRSWREDSRDCTARVAKAPLSE